MTDRLGSEYSDSYAHFIAGGKTLAVIRKFEDDCKNHKQLIQNIADEYGAKRVWPELQLFLFEHETNHPALKLEEHDAKSGTYEYTVDEATPEGKALAERFKDTPSGLTLTFRIFAHRLTGTEETERNPDKIITHSNNDTYGKDKTTTSAIYYKYKDTYVVSVPITVKAIFSEAAKNSEDHGGHIIGHSYDWFTPPDSQQIPSSKVVELQEKAKGDQLIRHKVIYPKREL